MIIDRCTTYIIGFASKAKKNLQIWALKWKSKKKNSKLTRQPISPPTHPLTGRVVTCNPFSIGGPTRPDPFSQANIGSSLNGSGWPVFPPLPIATNLWYSDNVVFYLLLMLSFVNKINSYLTFILFNPLVCVVFALFRILDVLCFFTSNLYYECVK